MSFSRYRGDQTVRAGSILSTAKAVPRIRKAVKLGEISINLITLKESTRLDHIAGEVYGTGTLWWIIAAASNIGWAMQVPAGTQIVIPTDLGEVMSVV